MIYVPAKLFNVCASCSGSNEVQRRPLDVNEVVREVLKLVRSDLASRDITVIFELSSALPTVIGDRVLLQQVLLNLIFNGCDAVADTELAAHRRLHIHTLWNGETVQVSVGDQGQGIALDDMEHLFEPFFTTKPKAWAWDSPSAALSSMPITDSFGPQITPIAARAFISRCLHIREKVHERLGAYRFYSRRRSFRVESTCAIAAFCRTEYGYIRFATRVP